MHSKSLQYEYWTAPRQSSVDVNVPQAPFASPNGVGASVEARSQ